MTNQQNANPTLPNWPFDRFTTDSSLDRVVRVAAVEQMVLAAYGPLHVPDKDGNERYFAKDIDARVQRRWIAQHIVDRQEWRDRFAAINALPHGAVLPSMRETAEAQRAQVGARAGSDGHRL